MNRVHTVLVYLTTVLVASSSMSAAEVADPLCSIQFHESTDIAAVCSAASSCVNIDLDTTQISMAAMEANLPAFSDCLPNVSMVTGDFAFGAGSMPLLKKVKGNLRIEKKTGMPGCSDTDGIIVGGAAGAQHPLVVTGSVIVAASDGCNVQSIEMPSIFSVDGEFLVITSGTGVIGAVNINANAANDIEQQSRPMRIAGGFRVEVVDPLGEIGDVEVHNVAALGTSLNTGAALAVVNAEGHIGNIRVVGAVKTGLSILGERGITLLQAGGTGSAAPSTSRIAYSGMVMVENVLTINGTVSVATDANSGGFLAGLSLIPSPSNVYSFDVGGDITVVLDGSYCRKDGIRLSLPEEHRPRYQYGPRILFTNVSGIVGTIHVESNGGSCLSDLEVMACPAVKDAMIGGGVQVRSASTSKSPGGINVFRADSFNTIHGDVAVRATGAAQTVASIIRVHVDAKTIEGSVSVSTDLRGVIHNAEFWDNNQISSGRLERIGGNLAIDGTISTGVRIFGTSTFEVAGNVSIAATGYRQGTFDPRGEVNIPMLSFIGGNLDIGQTHIVPEININTALDGKSTLHVKGSVRIGNSPTKYGIGVPLEGELWTTDAETFVGSTTVGGLAEVDGNLEIASNICNVCKSDADSVSNGNIWIAGHADTNGFRLGGALKMVAIKGSPERNISISGIQQFPQLGPSERQIYQVNSASFGALFLNDVEIDSSQIPPEERMARDALCITKCNGFGFVGEIRGGGCSNRMCTCFDERYGQYCNEQATPCTAEQFESSPVTSTYDRVCTNARLCGAGEVMVAPLQATSDRICKACPNGQFQHEFGHVHSACTSWSPACDKGSYESVSPTSVVDRKCVALTACAGNEIEIRAASASADRACMPCQDDEFASAVSNTCMPISSCKLGHTEVSPPTVGTDRVCKECPDGTFINKHGTNCVTWAPECAAGMYESQMPSKSVNRQCSPCAAGTFQGDDSRKGANSSCEPWSQPCSDGFYEASPATRFADRSCQELPPCAAGYLRQLDDSASSSPSSSTSIAGTVTYECRQWSVCNKGSYAAVAPSSTADRVCTICPAQSYQDRVAHTEPNCKAWTFEEGTYCPAGTYEDVAASQNADRLCSKCDLLLANGLTAASSVPAACLAFLNDALAPVPTRTEESSLTNAELAEKNAGMGLVAGIVLGALIFIASIAYGVKKVQPSASPKPGDKDFNVVMKDTNFKINPNNYPTLARARGQKILTKEGNDAHCSQPYASPIPPRPESQRISTIAIGTAGLNNASLSLNLSNMPIGTSSMDLYSYIKSPIKSLTSTPTAKEPAMESFRYEAVDDLETSIYLEPTLQTTSTGFVDEEGMYDASTMPERTISPTNGFVDEEGMYDVNTMPELVVSPANGLGSPTLSPTAAVSATSTVSTPQNTTKTSKMITPRPTLWESPGSTSKSPPIRLVQFRDNDTPSTPPGSGLRLASTTALVSLPTVRRPVMTINVDAGNSSSTTTPPVPPRRQSGARHPMFDVRRSTKVALVQGKPIFRTDLLAKKDSTPLRSGFTVAGLGGIDASTESATKATPSSAMMTHRQEGLRSISISPTLSMSPSARRDSFENFQNAGFMDEQEGMYAMDTMNGQLAGDYVPEASSPEYRSKSVTSLV